MGSQRVRHDWMTNSFTLTYFLKVNVCCLVTKSCLTLLWHHGLKWVAVSCSRGCLPDPGIKSVPLVLSGKFFTTESSGKPNGIYSFWYTLWASLVAQRVKHLTAMRETWVQSQGQADPLEKEMATHSSTFAWKIPLTEVPGGPQSMGSQRVGHDWATSLSLHLFLSIHKSIKYTYLCMYKHLCIVFLNFTFLALKMFFILLKASWNFQTNALSSSAPNQGWTVPPSSSDFLWYKYHSHFCYLDMSTSQTPLKGEGRHHSIDLFFFFILWL